MERSRYFLNLFLLFIFIVFIPQKYANAICPEYLKSYPEDCKIFEKYERIKNNFSEFGVNPEHIAGYRAMRIVNVDDLEKNFSGPTYRPWGAYGEKTWVHWESGNFAREQLNIDLDLREKQSGSWSLNVDDLKKLHKSIIDPELLGTVQKRLYGSSLYHSQVPEIGEFRRGNQITSGFNDANSEERSDFYKRHDLTDSNGKPILKYNKGRVSYLDSARVSEAMNDLIIEINNKVGRYLKGEKINESPLDFAAYIQRKYVAIHPFHEANGRMSRIIQDLILTRLGLPLVPGGLLQNDVGVHKELYLEKTRDKVHDVLAILSHCIDKIKIAEKSESSSIRVKDLYSAIPSECQPVYSGYREDLYDQLDGVIMDNEKFDINKRIVDVVSNSVARDCKPKEVRGKLTHLYDLLGDVQRILSHGDLVTDSHKRVMLENLAEEIPADLITYHWVDSLSTFFKRKSLIQSDLIFKKYLGETSEVAPGLLLGKGLYVSENPFDSILFSLSENDRNKVNDFLKKQDIDGALKVVEAANQSGRLMKITIKKEQKRLDLTKVETLKNVVTHVFGEPFPENPSLSQFDKIREETMKKVGRLNPNVMITFRGTTKQWSVLKFQRPSLAIGSSIMHPKDVSIQESLVINKLLKDNSKESGLVYILRGFKIINDVVQHGKAKWEKECLEHQGSSTVGSIFIHPYTEQCVRIEKKGDKPILIHQSCPEGGKEIPQCYLF